MNIVVKRIEDLRKQRSWSKAELSRRIGVSATTVSNWSSRDFMPDLYVIDRICSSMKITVEQFFYGIDKPKEDESAEKQFLFEWKRLSESGKAAVVSVINVLTASKSSEVKHD